MIWGCFTKPLYRRGFSRPLGTSQNSCREELCKDPLEKAFCTHMHIWPFILQIWRYIIKPLQRSFFFKAPRCFMKPLGKGFFKAPYTEELHTHICTFQSFFLQIWGYFSNVTLQLHRVLCDCKHYTCSNVIAPLTY